MNNKLLPTLVLSCALLLAGCGKKVDEVQVVPEPIAQPSAPIIVNPTVPTSVEVVEPAMSESDARTIAETQCISQGESISSGSYNVNSKTWWFDATLSNPKAGCNPACVVSEDGSFEINWRCTGAIVD